MCFFAREKIMEQASFADAMNVHFTAVLSKSQPLSKLDSVYTESQDPFTPHFSSVLFRAHLRCRKFVEGILFIL